MPLERPPLARRLQHRDDHAASVHVSRRLKEPQSIVAIQGLVSGSRILNTPEKVRKRRKGLLFRVTSGCTRADAPADQAAFRNKAASTGPSVRLRALSHAPSAESPRRIGAAPASGRPLARRERGKSRFPGEPASEDRSGRRLGWRDGNAANRAFPVRPEAGGQLLPRGGMDGDRRHGLPRGNWVNRPRFHARDAQAPHRRCGD